MGYDLQYNQAGGNTPQTVAEDKPLPVAGYTAEGTLMASASRSALTSSEAQTNRGYKTVVLWLNITVLNSASVEIKLEGQDPVSGLWAPVMDKGGCNSVALWRFAVGVGCSNQGEGSMSGVAGVPIPRTWRVTVNPADASANTYSVGASYGY